MTLKALATPLTLLAGLTLGTGAFAQTTVGTVTVSEEDLPIVQRYCEDLADDRAADPSEQSDDSADDGSKDDSATDDEVEVDPLDEVQTDVSLESINIGDCEDAGLLDDYTPAE